LLPISLERPTKELIEHFLRPLQPDEGPAFVHPLLAVVKRYDIRQAAAAVTAFLADPEGDDVGEFLFWDQLASHDKAVYLPAVDELNDFIRFLSNVEPDKARRHTLAAVKVRPVVDMHAVNQLLPECRFSYPSPTDAAALVQPGFEMGKIDWYKAFNQFPVHEDDAKYMAVVIKGQCYVPKRALFGGSLFPHYVSTVMAAVVELMNAHDVPSTAMVDDFFTTGPPGPPSIPSSCAGRMVRAHAMMTAMGFRINDDKTEGPARQLAFKGILIDSDAGTLSIPPARLEDVDATLAHFYWTRRDAEVLLEHLNWLCTVLQAGRPHLARLRHGLNYLMKRHVRQAIDQHQRQALLWFQKKLQPRVLEDLWTPFWPGGVVPVSAQVWSDASGTDGFGLIIEHGDARTMYRGKWRVPPGPTPEAASQQSSSFYELVPIFLAVQLLAPQMHTGGVLVFTTDNLGNAFAINKGHCRSSEAFQLLRMIFTITEAHHVFLVSEWVPRECNHLLDLLPRPYMETVEALITQLSKLEVSDKQK